MTMRPTIACVLGGLLAGCAAPPTDAPPPLPDRPVEYPPLPQRPVEYPPLDYVGSVYVDSAGCAFVRAGDADTVVWVPRVTLDRRPVCGLPPSLPAEAAPGPGA